MKRDNPNNSELPEVFRRLEALESGNPFESASVTGGRVRFIGGLLRVDSGGKVEIVGTLEIDGATTVTGTFQVDGPWELNGDGTITGDVTITGTISMVGSMKLTGDITVEPGGRIVIEGGDQIVLEQSGGVARIGMGASEIRGGSGIGLYSNAGPSIISTAAGLRVATLPTISGTSVDLPPGTIYVNATGFLYRVV